MFRTVLLILLCSFTLAYAAAPKRTPAATPAAIPVTDSAATPAASTGKRVALIIGNGSYKDSPLKNPPNDAEDMAALLRRLGFDVISRKNANQRDMKAALRDFGQRLRGAEAGLFYFAGHGLQVKGVNYLVPVAADIQSEAEAEDQTVSLDYVMRILEEGGAQFNVAILDACRNNPFARSFRSASRGLAQAQAATGTLIAYATAPGSVAADGEGRNGIYTRHLMQSIRETDGDILRVFQRVRTGVVQETGRKQTPWESISLVGDFYFRPPRTGQAAQGSANTQPTQVAMGYQPPRSKPAGDLKPGDRFRDCDGCPEMVVIPAGSFSMGADDGDDNEKPAHRVSIGRSFAIGRTEVTQGQWEAIMGKNPSGFSSCGDACPVENVNWNDAQEFARRLSQKTGKIYRLPSEAEWEYACRSGGTHKYCGSDDAEAVAWHNGNSGRKPRPVAQKQANAWGLYDMSGNVYEWTEDCWNGDYKGAPVDGSAWNAAVSDGSVWKSASCGRHPVRGGSWFNSQNAARAASRYGNFTTIEASSFGLRIVRELP